MGDNFIFLGVCAAFLGITMVPALGSERLTPEESVVCEKIANEGLRDWKKVDLRKIPTPSSDLEKYKYEIRIAFHVVNHQSFFEGRVEEKTIFDDLKFMRKAFRPCSIEVVAQQIRYVETPDFLKSFERDSRHVAKITEKQRCLFSSIHVPGAVNVYYVDPSFGGPLNSYSLARYFFFNDDVKNEEADEKFIGSVVVLDSDRGRHIGPLVTAHEVAHSVLNSGHFQDNFKYNLLSDDPAKVAPILESSQCDDARYSPFLRRR